MSEKNIPKYDFKVIEKKWQEKWEKEKTNQVDLDKAKKPFYNLMMFPYPSAEGLHIGGVFTFTGVDTFGRFKRMQGYDVFEPIGLDGFGIHAENYAIKIKEHIKKVSERTEKNFYRQLGSVGNMYDWSRTVETYKPEYYKWTQWIFLQMYKKGLAYQKKAKVNWCPSCKTVLSDEQVIQGKCERCDSEVEKKELKQWFFAITKYADRLLKNLEWIDWPEDVKGNQRNWIGKSEGARIKFPIAGDNYLEVFTTRPDTIFGATYIVIAPELVKKELITSLQEKIENWDEVSKYVSKSLSKSDQERKEDEKSKTGVEIKGINAINPATGKEIPIWVADYVLGDYGTGAIMAVPAHDERDFEFAKKYGLEIEYVVEPYFCDNGSSESSIKPGEKIEKREAVCVVVRNPKNGKYLCIKWRKAKMHGLVTGGIGKREGVEETARREVLEETGYRNLKLVNIPEVKINTVFYHRVKEINRWAHFHYVFFDLIDEEKDEIDEREAALHEVVWKKKEELDDFFTVFEGDYVVDLIKNGTDKPFCKEGIAVNSNFLDGLKTKEAKKKIVEWLNNPPLNPPLRKGGTIGEKAVDYKLRDWCVSRQRYWGPPIPVIHCKKCGVVPVDEKDLPVLLPEMDDFLPEGKGKGPLAKNEKFVKTKCPVCGGEAERETDVSDPFVDSSWYFLRYPSTEFDGEIFDKKRTHKWLPVDSYIGGKEHTVLHLLYSRFVTMVLNDLGYLDFDEPYKKFIGHGLITKDGAKMSKSKGNVVNPDEMIEKYGADTTRLYLRFLGDFYQGGDWRDSGVAGMFKFVKRLWNTFYDLEGKGEGVEKLNMLDKTIKAVGEDIEKLSFNTAVARIMELVNWINENKNKFNDDQVDKVRKTLALIIAPFAPHLAEEFYSTLTYTDGMQIDTDNETHRNASLQKSNSIFDEAWPKYDPKNIIDDEIELAVQVNGKLRAVIKAAKDISEKEAIELARNNDKVKKFIGDNKIKKEIFVPGRLVNFVV